MNSVRALVSAALVVALTPSTALASTWTVDDDKAECPNAAFTSIQAAVNQAAPWDTVIVCPGLYLESSTPTSGNNSPSQAGSRNGLTITKPLTIKGAGASKVTIRPAPSLAPTLAGTAPYLRDGGGNVVTIARQSLGSTDDNENFVDISGVTIESPDVAAEAAIAFFNTSGRIANSVIGPVTPAGPHGYGVVMSNHMQGAEAGVRRQVNIVGSLVNGNVFFDDARGADGAATTTQRSGIVAYGNINGSRIVGDVAYNYGQRGSIANSEITGLLALTDAELGPDPSNPDVRAFSATGSSLTGGLTNTSTTPAFVPGNYWGDAIPSGPVELGTPLTDPPAALSVPAATPDALPTGVIVDPIGPTVVEWGETISPVVIASDDFGIKSVSLTAGGLPVATLSTAPYEFTWTPDYSQIGEIVPLTFTVTDSSGQSIVVTTEVTVPAITTEAEGTVGGTVPATLALSVGAPATFGAFIPGVERDYAASTTATVLSTAGDATLSVTDPSATAPGHLVNGTFTLPSALKARATNAANTGTPFAAVSGSPLTLLTWTAPTSNDAVTLEFVQTIGATDALRTGTYSKTLTYTLSTTTP
jgi:hypothetical protein